MLKFINFIREDCDILAEIGVAIVVNDELYDIEFIYNQAFQEYNMLSPFQVVFCLSRKFNSIKSSMLILKGKLKINKITRSWTRNKLRLRRKEKKN